MKRPSDAWKDYGSWKGFCDSYPNFSAIKFDALESMISRRRDSMACRVTSSKFVCGGLNVLFEAVFDDDKVWLCRAGWIGDEYSSTFLETMMYTTVTAMRYLAENSSLRIPEVYAYEGNKNEIGAPYMLLEPLEGLSYMDMLELPDFEVDEFRIDENVAKVMLQLSQITFPAIGWLYETSDGVQVGPIVDYSGVKHGPFNTSVEYFSWRAKQASEIQHTWKAECEESALKSDFVCWLFTQAAPMLSERNDGPFPLMHPDAWGQQLLMDKDYTVHGVVDWDEASTVPWLEFCTYPSNMKWLIHRFENNEYNPKVVQLIKESREQYRLSLNQGGFDDSLLKLVGSKEAQVADCLIHFSNPVYKYEGRTVFEFLFGSTEGFEEFRDRKKSGWMLVSDSKGKCKHG
jgi:hypothetical protein